METMGVPMVGIGDQLPPYSVKTARPSGGTMDLHDWVTEAQTYKEGEEVFCVILTFPPVKHPVVVSELGFLGRPETQKELARHKVKVQVVLTSTLFETNSFLRDLPSLVDVDGWDLGSITVVVDEDCGMQRYLGCVRPGASDAVRGRTPSNLSLIVSPRLEVMWRCDYPMTTGRNYFELFRVLDSFKVTYHFPRLGTWANWQPGGQEGMLVMPSYEDGSILTKEECDKLFPKGTFECIFPWFRITPVPDLPGAESQLALTED